MTTRRQRAVLTYDDYARLPDDGRRYELYDGEFEVAPAPNTRHQRTVRNLWRILDGHTLRLELGEVFVAPYDVVLSNSTVLQPDLLFISRERAAIIHPENARGAPDLVVEVISPGTRQRDRRRKRDLYARYGVPYYWLIDPDRGEIEAYQLVNGTYQLVAQGRGADTFSAPPFPDLVIALADLWP